MPKLTSNAIRQQFLDFFKSKAHDIVPSSPVVPYDDPTLLFTNAGMNQFKPIFLGTVSPNDPHAKMKRAADTQKCIRAGGKHNDLDDVGKDTYHHTFFEMLGNWSFGDYFKKEAIEWAWELLTKVWKIDKSRLHATYFQGDESEGLEPDGEAAALWRTVTDIDPSHVHPGNKKDNFWEMGDTGPCGPCSEIHIDLTPDKSGGHLVNAGDASVMEVWNLVFIQFNRGSDGKLTPLPAKHVDTGMGFERISSVLQSMEADRLGNFSNYDTDVFTPIFQAIQKRTNAPEYRGTLPSDVDEPQRHEGTETKKEVGKSDQNRDREGAAPPSPSLSKGGIGGVTHEQIMIDVTYRVIADHLRSLTFAITDGAVPDNKKRGSTLRSILRRAERFGYQFLGTREPFLCDLVQALVEHMSGVFPELRTGPDPKRQRDNIQYVANILREEEDAFLKTLGRGIKLFDEVAEHALQHQEGCIGGEAAFRLHDTYGFPFDLTQLMALERGLRVDHTEYKRLTECAKDKARGTSVTQTLVFPEITSAAGICDDTLKYSYPPKCTTSIVVHAGQTDSTDTYVQFATRQTCFYVEQGGQVSDVGWVRTEQGEARISEVSRSGQTVLHTALVTQGRITSGNCVLEVDVAFRQPTMQNHTATHIMNWALREVLGDHVQQKGSLVDPEKTRFDLSHPHPISNEELARIEKLTNEQVAAKLQVYTKEVGQAEARKINTLRAVFGEKYPDVVRVVSIGADIDEMLKKPDDPKWMKFSVEFCGGTHVDNSSKVERFVIVSEEGVAKGVRRVVGVTGETARKAHEEGQRMLREANELVGSATRTGSSGDGKAASGPHGGPYDLASRVSALTQSINDAVIPILVRHELREKIAELQKIAKQHEKQSAAASGDAVMDKVKSLHAGAQTVSGTIVVVGEVPAAPVDALRGAIDWIRQKSPSSAVLLAMVDDNRVTLLAGMSKDVVDRGVKAGDLIKEISPLVGGKGGGRPDMAQGGGTDASGLPKAIEAAIQWIAGKLK